MQTVRGRDIIISGLVAAATATAVAAPVGEVISLTVATDVEQCLSLRAATLVEPRPLGLHALRVRHVSDASP